MQKSYIFLQVGKVKIYNKLACFDVDWTLIKPKSNRKFPKNNDDLQIWDKSIIKRLNNLIKDQYTIVLITNQKNKNNENAIEKANNIYKILSVPFLYLASFKDDKYRKPALGLWNKIKKYINDIDINNSFFVGDAAGRLNAWEKGKKKDFSDSDRKFAYNIGINFNTPEEFFLDYSATNKWSWIGWNPESILPKSSIPNFEKAVEIIVVMGLPASGKTTFINQYFNDYIYYSGDKDGNNKLLKLVEKSMNKKESIIVEGLFYTSSSRQKVIELIKKYDYNSKLFIMNINRDLALHLNKWRYLQGNKKIPMVVYNKWKKHYEEPTEEWDKIIKIIPKWKKQKWQKIFFNN